MKIDCFLSTCAKDPLRFGLAMATLHRLANESSLRTTVLRTKDAWLEPKDLPTHVLECDDFQIVRRMHAESKAKTDIYFMADDDVLPQQDNFVELGLEAMSQYPEFAILALLPTNATIQLWTPESYRPFVDETVMEHVSVGGLYFIRKGAMKQWPEGYQNRYDALQGEYLRSQGQRVGFLRKLTMNHLGEGYCSILVAPALILQ